MKYLTKYDKYGTEWRFIEISGNEDNEHMAYNTHIAYRMARDRFGNEFFENQFRVKLDKLIGFTDTKPEKS